MSLEATNPGRKAGVQRVFLEAMLVATSGLVLAFAANGLSPRGLKLSRNYFPTGTNYFPAVTNVSVPMPAATEPAREVAATNHTSLTTSPPTLIVVPRLSEKGLQAIDGDQAVRFFQDVRRQQGLVVFVDARSDQDYQEAHIPGAYQFNPYRPEQYLTVMLPICQAAEQVVIYCKGSDCEDSELGAILLRDAGLANQKLFVYVNGIAEWTAGNLPVEIGGRNSGNVRNANQ